MKDDLFPVYFDVVQYTTHTWAKEPIPLDGNNVIQEQATLIKYLKKLKNLIICLTYWYG